MTDEFKASLLKVMAPLEGWCTLEKACIMADIILDHKPTLAVETGIFGGKSAIPIAMAMREAGSGVLYGIDPWTVDAAIAGEQPAEHVDWWSNKVNLEDIYRGFVRAVLDLNLTYHLRWLRLTSDKASKCFRMNSVGLFHQDSNHSEEVSCREVKLFEPIMKRQSFWVFDDSDWTSTQKAIGMIREFGFEPFHKADKFTVFKR